MERASPAEHGRRGPYSPDEYASPRQPGLELAYPEKRPITIDSSPAPLMYASGPEPSWDSYSRSVPGYPPPPPPPKGGECFAGPAEKRICGLRVSTFALSLALVVLVIGAGVGGGVGGSMAANTAKSLSECQNSNALAAAASDCGSATRTVTVSSPSPTGDTSYGDTSSTGVPAASTAASRQTLSTAANGGIVVPTSNVVVGLDCPGLEDQTVVQGSRSWQFTVACGRDLIGEDITATTSYSLRDCLRNCAAYNLFQGKDDCKAVVFSSLLSSYLPGHNGNCWLKKTTGGAPSDVGNDIVTANLVGS